MARKEQKTNSRKINGILDTLDTQTSDLYKSTYNTTPTNKQMFGVVSDELTSSIKKAIQGDSNYEDISNTTRFYQRLVEKKGDITIGSNILSKDNKDGNIMDIFDDKQMMANLMDTYANTKWIRTLDEEIDMCLKYMPKLQQALNIKKDNVLCADSFNKSFVQTTLENSINPGSDVKFSANSKSILKTYEFEEKTELWYDLASKYGETFVYCVPYKKAFQTLLQRKKNTNYALKESTIASNGVLTESYKPKSNTSITGNVKSGKSDASKEQCSIKLNLDMTGMLGSVIENMELASKRLESDMYRSVYEDVIHEATTGKVKEYKLNRTISDELEYEDDASANDGLVTSMKNEAKANIKVPGCVLKTIDRDKIIPLYMEDMCLGYYHINFNIENLTDVNTASVTNGYNTITSMFTDTVSANQEDTGDQLLKYISGKISENIDAAFINTNQDLRKEIYMMLKYNDKFNQVANTVDVNVTFIPREDIVHIKFNENPKTHRGQSDIWNGLIDAKMWIMLKTTSVIGNVTRGQDKRVYYVKTQVETNVARTLLNVVEQLKKGNFGMRQMESINNILSVVGKFNDFIIPVGPSGESPITFDIMQGQQFDLPVELMTDLEDSAVGSTGVPLEIVNSSLQQDFAIRYSMTNGRMLRDILKRQNYMVKVLSSIFTKIYNCEFEDNAEVKVILPVPAFLVITQGSQLVQTTTQYIASISESLLAGYSDEDKNMFGRKMMERNLASYVDMEMIDSILDEIKLAKNIKKTEDELNSDDEV